MIRLSTDTLITGIDRWHVENIMPGKDFFWFGHPFKRSRSLGFIYTEKPFVADIPQTLIVDLEDSGHLDPVSFNISYCIFYSGKWTGPASRVASFIRNIIYFRDGSANIIKKDYKILEA